MNRQRMIALLICVPFASQLIANTLIITRGPIYSAMGSYLSNAITSQDESYYAISQVDIANSCYYQLLNDLFPKEMELISQAIEPENISYAITNYHVYFKDTAYTSQKEQALDVIQHIRTFFNDPTNKHISDLLLTTLQHITFARLAYLAACGHNIVWESGTVINFENDTDEQIKQGFDNIITTITYCHPTQMIDKWLIRNTNAINEKKAYNRRLLKKVFQSFFNCFQPTTDENAIVVLTKDEFDAIIQQACQYIQTVPTDEKGEDGIFTRTEFTLEELEAFKQEKYIEFNFEQVDHVALAPIISYDIALNTQEDCLKFAASVIDQ